MIGFFTILLILGIVFVLTLTVKFITDKLRERVEKHRNEVTVGKETFTGKEGVLSYDSIQEAVIRAKKSNRISSEDAKSLAQKYAGQGVVFHTKNADGQLDANSVEAVSAKTSSDEYIDWVLSSGGAIEIPV